MGETPSASIVAGLQVTPTVKLVRPLGAGGMGAVWLADHTGLKTQVVVKFMLAELDGSEAAKGRFSREAAAAAQVKSPHVVQMLDHGLTDKGVPFIVMEHLEGHDLSQELEEGKPLDARRTVAIITQVAKALGKVHAAGLLHRDIKPENIFLVEGEEDVFVKLLDFGIAKSQAAAVEATTPDGLDNKTKTGQVVGTPFYMSPEQVTAQKEIDARADVWSLGVVAYQLLTGMRPFEGPSFGALAVKIASGPLPKPTEANRALPTALDAWFAKACAREPSARFATAKELADGLRGALDGTVSLPPSASSGERATSKKVSIRPDADSSPSIENATTVAHTPEPLAQSEGAVSVTSPKEKPNRNVPIAIGIAVLALVGAAGYIVTAQSPPVTEGKPVASQPASATTETVVATASAPASATAPAPASAPASATASAPATATAIATAPASARPDAGPHVGWRPPIATTNHLGARPSASADTAPRPPSSSGLAPDVF